MNELLWFLAILGFIAAIVCLFKVFFGSEKASKKDLKMIKIEILKAAVASDDDVKNFVDSKYPDFDALTNRLQDARKEMAGKDGEITVAIESERQRWQKGDNDNITQIRTEIQTEVNGAKKLVDGKVDKADLDKQVAKVVEDVKNTIDKLREELKGVITNGDQKVYSDIGGLLKKRNEDEDKALDEIRKALNDFKEATIEKSEEVRKAMGNFYPDEVLAGKLNIELDVAQKLIDLGLDVEEKIVAMEAINFAVAVTGVVELPQAVQIHAKAKAIVKDAAKVEEKPQEAPKEIKTEATVSQPTQPVETKPEEV